MSEDRSIFDSMDGYNEVSNQFKDIPEEERAQKFFEFLSFMAGLTI